MIVFKLFLWAKFIVFRVSDIVPTWFGLISTVFEEFFAIDVFILFIDVTKRSSPTIWICEPIALFNFVQFYVWSNKSAGENLRKLGKIQERNHDLCVYILITSNFVIRFQH